jgi:hypothetical protein
MAEKQKRYRISNPKSLRHLPQFRDMSDEEFETYYKDVVVEAKKDHAMEERVIRLMEKFEDEYDLADLLPNDRAVLDNLIRTIIQLDDYMDIQNKFKAEGVTESNVFFIEKLANICKMMRADISSMQNDLGITRKNRKNDKEQSTITMLEDLKKKAKQFYQERMIYIFCEKCGTLLHTSWWLFGNKKSGKIHVGCHHEVDGVVCGWEKDITAKDIIENGGTNRPDLMPDSMK